MDGAGSRANRAFSWLDLRGARQRLAIAALCGGLAWLAAPASFALATCALLAWVSAGVVLLVIAFVIIVRADATETRRRAAADDPGHTAVWIVVLVASTISLFAATVVIRDAKLLPSLERHLLLALSVATAVVSWLVTHTAFTLRYAHLYYRGGPDQEGGIAFPPGDPPDDLDFAYFAFTIGMCFQVSDLAITSGLVRRTVLAHSILSFAYTTGILALVLNLVVGQLG